MHSSRSSQQSRRRRENAPISSRASAMQSSSSSPPSVTAAAATAAMAAVRDSDLFDRAPLAADEAPPPVEAAARVIDSDDSDFTSDEEAANPPATSAQGHSHQSDHRQRKSPTRQRRISNTADTASAAHGASADGSHNQASAAAAAAQCCAAGIQALARGSLHEAVRCFTAGTHRCAHYRAAFANRCILHALAGFYSAALPDAVWLLRGSMGRADDGDDSLSNPQILFKQVQTRARELVLPCMRHPNAVMAMARHEVEARMFEAVTMLDQVLQAESDVYTLIACDANAAIGICRALAALPHDIAHLGIDAVPMPPAVRANTAASAIASAPMRAPQPKTNLPAVRTQVPTAAKHAVAAHPPPAHDGGVTHGISGDNTADSDDESADEDDAVDAKSGRSAAPRSSSAGWFGR